MKILKKLFNNRMSILSLMLCFLAIFFGASSAIAMADVGAIADEKSNNTQLPGTAASGTQIVEGGLAEDEVDQYIAKFMRFRFPLSTVITSKAKRVPVKGMEIKHYASAAANLEGYTNAAITNNENMAETVTLPVSADTKKQLAKDLELYFPDITGYNASGVDNGKGLLCRVTEKTSSTLVIKALNGPLNSGDMYVPNIASGSKYLILGNAVAESQMLVEPENYQPREKTVYLQKQCVNILITDFWKSIMKKVPLVEQDIRDNALYNFKRRKARTQWIGRQFKEKSYQGTTMGDEYVYHTEGIIPQITKMYGIGEALTYSDLIRLTKMQFTDFSVNDTVDAFCGKNFIEKLLNIDYTKHKDVEFKADTVLGFEVKAFKTNFGTINFAYDPTLDDVGYEDYCIIADISNAALYVNEAGRDYKVDMKKGAGENREASRDIHIEIDAIALKGYNAILVGPSNKLAGRAAPTAVITFSTLSALPTESLTDGMVVYLTAADSGWAAYSLVYYDLATTSWKEYIGEVSA